MEKKTMFHRISSQHLPVRVLFETWRDGVIIGTPKLIHSAPRKEDPGMYIPWKSKDHWKNRFSPKTVVFAGFFNHPKLETIILLVLDFQGMYVYNTWCSRISEPSSAKVLFLFRGRGRLAIVNGKRVVDIPAIFFSGKNIGRAPWFCKTDAHRSHGTIVYLTTWMVDFH